MMYIKIVWCVLVNYLLELGTVRNVMYVLLIPISLNNSSSKLVIP